jgi:hypothetical protein
MQSSPAIQKIFPDFYFYSLETIAAASWPQKE